MTISLDTLNTPEGEVFLKEYSAIISKKTVISGGSLVTSNAIQCFIAKNDDLNCITPGAAAAMVREIKKELEKKAAPRAEVPAPAAASASSSSSSSAELPKMPEAIEKIISDFKADRGTKAND